MISPAPGHCFPFTLQNQNMREMCTANVKEYFMEGPVSATIESV